MRDFCLFIDDVQMQLIISVLQMSIASSQEEYYEEQEEDEQYQQEEQQEQEQNQVSFVQGSAQTKKSQRQELDFNKVLLQLEQKAWNSSLSLEGMSLKAVCDQFKNEKTETMFQMLVLSEAGEVQQSIKTFLLLNYNRTPLSFCQTHGITPFQFLAYGIKLLPKLKQCKGLAEVRRLAIAHEVFLEGLNCLNEVVKEVDVGSVQQKFEEWAKKQVSEPEQAVLVKTQQVERNREMEAFKEEDMQGYGLGEGEDISIVAQLKEIVSLVGKRNPLGTGIMAIYKYMMAY